MRHALSYVLILAAAAFGYLLLASGTDDDGPADFDADDTPAPMHEDLTTTLEAPTMPTRDRPAPPKRRPPKVVDPRTIPRGRIDVYVVGPDLKPILDGDLRVDVEPTGRKDWATRLGQLDPKQGAWVFRKVLAGEVEIRVRGDHVISKRQIARVRADRTSEATVHVDRAGAIHYDVVLYDKTRPKQVTLTLFDWQDRPVLAWYQARSRRTSTSPTRVRTITQGPEGAVFGVYPGHYRLRAVSENNEWDDIQLELKPGQTEQVTFVLRR